MRRDSRHKMIRCNLKKIGIRFDLVLLALNIPSITALAALSMIYLLIIRGMNAPADFYETFYLGFFCTALYSFAVTLGVTVTANIRLRGHKKYTYIEILPEQLIISRYVYTSSSDGRRVDCRRLWVMNLADIEQVTCTRNKMIIKGKGRFFEGNANWLDYEEDDMGRADFDYWWNSEYGGVHVDSASFPDCFTYAERVAQRIIFCSDRHKMTVLKRSEFRKRMLEIAKRGRAKKKPKERVFRGYEIERKF